MGGFLLEKITFKNVSICFPFQYFTYFSLFFCFNFIVILFACNSVQWCLFFVDFIVANMQHIICELKILVIFLLLLMLPLLLCMCVCMFFHCIVVVIQLKITLFVIKSLLKATKSSSYILFVQLLLIQMMGFKFFS